MGGGKDAGSSTSNMGAGSDEVGAAEEQGGSKTFRNENGKGGDVDHTGGTSKAYRARARKEDDAGGHGRNTQGFQE